VSNEPCETCRMHIIKLEMDLQILTVISTDWLLYWETSEAEAGRAFDTREKPQSNNNINTGSSPPQASPTSSNHHNADNNLPTKSESDSVTSSPTPLLNLTNSTTTTTNESYSHYSPTGKKPFAYWPHLLFLGLLAQIAIFVSQFHYYREYGGVTWPWLYAAGAPATTCLYVTSCLKMAPLRWPVLGA
jgi:hypothetical protein